MLRRPWPAVRRPDEDWTLLLVAAATVLLVLGTGLLTAWSAHQRDAGLRDAAATAGRLAGGGVDDQLSQGLITLQQDEVVLFGSGVDAGQDSAPRADLGQVQSALATVAADPLGGSTRVQRDVSLISRELPVYQGLEATAQADEQQGLPIGAAYLREASSYLNGDLLQSADDIRRVDQGRLTADDRSAGRFPLGPTVVDGLCIVLLVGVQVLAARYSRRTLNPGLAGATVLVLVLSVWSVTAFAVSRYQLGNEAVPHALAAVDLTRVQLDATNAHIDDQLTLADDGEDCAVTEPKNHPTDYHVACTLEDGVITQLTASSGSLLVDLGSALRQIPKQTAGQRLGTAVRAAAGKWLAAEGDLPTLQNLAARTRGLPPSTTLRYDPAFLKDVLVPFYSQPAAASPAVKQVNAEYQALLSPVDSATSGEWSSYQRDDGDAAGTLGGLVPGGLLLGLLAAGAVATGLGWRVAEYWSSGRSQP